MNEVYVQPNADAVDKIRNAFGCFSTKDDTISRQAAIDALNVRVTIGRGDGKSVWLFASTIANEYADIVKKRIEALPSSQPEQRWIPVTERLPKPYEYCLWTTTDGKVIYHHCDGLFSNYTAWMPLPEPYIEEED